MPVFFPRSHRHIPGPPPLPFPPARPGASATPPPRTRPHPAQPGCRCPPLAVLGVTLSFGAHRHEVPQHGPNDSAYSALWGAAGAAGSAPARRLTPFVSTPPGGAGDSCAPLYLQPDAPPAERRSQRPWRTGPSENHQRFPRFPLNRAASCWWAVRSLQRHSGREPLRTRTRRLRGPPWASGLATSPSVPVGAGKLASACHRRQPKPDPGRRRERGPPSGSFLASRELIPDRLSRHPPWSDSPRRVRAPTSPELTRFLLSN